MLQKNSLREYCLAITSVLKTYDNKPRRMPEIESLLTEYIRSEADRAIKEYFGTTDGRETVLLVMQKFRGDR
jgi:predicted metal-dependent enzyme (double-stranded beta helix superfamily)